MADISDSDRDLMIRTTVGEADDQPAIGQAAVAHVIMNRVADGRWGDTPSQVVLARGQFEPWQTRARELTGIKPTSALSESGGRR
jgi:spore germination cell wall hydrolase CwlJ-like protein